MSEDIEVKSWSENKLLYTKKIGEFSFEYEICVVEEGIDWSLRSDPLCTNHSVGLALPYHRDWCDFSEETIKEDIANYSSFFHKSLYSDQRILDIPCIFADNTMAFGSIENSYQFFRYQDGDSHWLRITTSTSTPTDDVVEFCIRTNSSDISRRYLEKFPEADEFINKWKAQFKELGELFGIDILCQQSETVLNKGDVTYVSKTRPTGKDLKRFYPVLKRELMKYPASFFADLSITSIQLVADLWIQTDRIKQEIDPRRLPGYYAGGILWTDGGRGIILSIRSPVSVLHHEIFHGIQQERKFDSMPGEISQFSDSTHITDTNEFLAELFTLLMTNPGKAYSLVSVEQIDYLKQGVKDFVNFPDLPSKTERRTILAITPTGTQEIMFGDICETATYYSFRDKL